MVTGFATVTPKVVTVKVADFAPPRTVTLAGTVAAAGLLLARVTITPVAGATPVSATVPVLAVPPVTLVGLSVRKLMASGVHRQAETAADGTDPAAAGGNGDRPVAHQPGVTVRMKRDAARVPRTRLRVTGRHPCGQGAGAERNAAVVVGSGQVHGHRRRTPPLSNT